MDQGYAAVYPSESLTDRSDEMAWQSAASTWVPVGVEDIETDVAVMQRDRSPVTALAAATVVPSD